MHQPVAARRRRHARRSAPRTIVAATLLSVALGSVGLAGTAAIVRSSSEAGPPPASASSTARVSLERAVTPLTTSPTQSPSPGTSTRTPKATAAPSPSRSAVPSPSPTKSAAVPAPEVLDSTAKPAFDWSKAKAAIHVSTAGKDSNPGTPALPKRTVQAAVDAVAGSGGIVVVHAGTYRQQIFIRDGGIEGKDLTIVAAGDGETILTADLPVERCDSTQPAAQRTVMIAGGADYIRLKGLTIRGGIHIFGKGAGEIYNWHKRLVEAGNVTDRRAAPGRGTKDPNADPAPFLSRVTGKSVDPSEHISIVDNTITGKGVHVSFGRHGIIARNVISDILCGTGPGIWLITFADSWAIRRNDVSRVAASAAAHFMQEGIRVGGASNYSLIWSNVVHDLPGDGRAFNTDVDASFNTFSANVARNVAIGYNEQMSGWGNVWTNNSVEGYRTYGYAFRLMDASLSNPSLNSSSVDAVVRCNAASEPATGAKALGVGGIIRGDFDDNAITSAWISKNAKGYWSKTGSSWDGSANPPSTSPALTPGALACAPA